MEHGTYEVQPIAAESQDFDLIIDVRPHAPTSPSIAGSTIVELSGLLAEPPSWIPETTTRILIVCDIGLRSGLAARRLRAAGYDATVSLAGGIDAWRDAGLPLSDTAGLTPSQLHRYDRHLKLADIGVPGQEALLDATVVVIGAGGLGSPAIMYLAAAGVGTIVIVDDDTVDASNLQRQPIHQLSDIGEAKADSAAAFVTGLNPDVRAIPVRARLGRRNAAELFEGADVIIDASDNFATRYAINDAAVAVGVPTVFASVYAMEGQASVFGAENGPCYRCVFPEPPDDTVPLDCTTIGVLGATTGVLGAIQATEATKLITGAGVPLVGRLLLYDAGAASFTTLPIARDPACPVCAV